MLNGSWVGTTVRWTLCALVIASAAGCATASTGAIEPVGAPVADPSAAAAEAARATVPTGSRQITFAWTLEESGSRLGGRGVVRHQGGERLRLDLFGPRNESYLSAAMVGDEVRLPAGAAAGVAIPSPALLWAGLGVVRPPAASTLQDVTADDSVTVIRYRAANGDTYLYRLGRGASAPRLPQVARAGSRGVIESVRLEWGDTGALARARYRDWSAFRDLTLELQSVNDAASFPQEIWTP